MISSSTSSIPYSSNVPAAAREQGIAPAQPLKSQPAIQIVDPSKTSIPPSQNSNTVQSGQTGQNSSTSSPSESSDQASSSNEYEQAVQQVVSQLKARDSEVRAHELAHLSAAGGYATSGAAYVYQVGPDGNRYAVGGEVGIDISPIAGDPQATIQKATVVQRAALAPAEPSSQDYRVASAAAQMAAQARVELGQQEGTQASGSETGGETGDSATGSEASGDSDQATSVNGIVASDSQVNASGLQASRNEFDLRLSFQQQIA